MSSILKYSAAMLFAFVLIAIGVLYYNHIKEDGKLATDSIKSQSIKESSEQYNISFSFNGDRSQIIDLIKGNAELKLVYSGSSEFTAKLLNVDGSLLVNLADRYGPFSEKIIAVIPETGAYLLDVKTIGEWSLNKE